MLLVLKFAVLYKNLQCLGKALEIQGMSFRTCVICMQMRGYLPLIVTVKLQNALKICQNFHEEVSFHKYELTIKLDSMMLGIKYSLVFPRHSSWL